MIEVYQKNQPIKKYETPSDLPESDVYGMRMIGYSNDLLVEISNKYQLEVSIFHKKEDIEISSHYLESADQLSFNFSIPNFSRNSNLEEEEIFIILKDGIVFTFLSNTIDDNLNHLTKYRFDFNNLKFDTYLDLFVAQIGIISDYYADLVELNSKGTKQLFRKTLKSNQFVKKDLDLLTQLNFNNLLIKESLSEFQRIIILLRRNATIGKLERGNLKMELEDLSVISEHIQYNFDRLDDLKENINSKIDLEQNEIFKVLTIITVCISLPTLVAGIYGMNFQQMPELRWSFGYPLAIIMMVISFVVPLFYFRKKKWF